MRLHGPCLVLSVVVSAAVAEISAQTDLSAMTDEEIEALSEDVRIASETKEEEEDSNAGEGTDSTDTGAQTHTSSPGDWNYCKQQACGLGEGDCDKNSECKPGLVCGYNNCDPAKGWHALTDCCEKIPLFHRDYCKHHKCESGEGDCDCHRECAAGLKCGVNNCGKMNPGKKIPRWADCCTHCSSVKVGPPGMKTSIPAEYWDTNMRVSGAERNLVKPPLVLQPAAVWNLPALGVVDEIKIKCCRYQRAKCEFFISVYHCKPCSEDHNGGLPGHLLSSGWDGGSCSPRIELPGDMSGVTHGMITFHRTLYPGEVEVIPISKNAPHVAVFERTGMVVGPWCPPNTGPFPPGAGCTCIPGLGGR